MAIVVYDDGFAFKIKLSLILINLFGLLSNIHAVGTDTRLELFY